MLVCLQDNRFRLEFIWEGYKFPSYLIKKSYIFNNSTPAYNIQQARLVRVGGVDFIHLM